jgi:hypothetical protein
MNILKAFRKPKNNNDQIEKNKEHSVLKEKQKQIAQQLIHITNMALMDNNIYNIMSDGKASDKVERPVAELVENGESHSILIKRPEDEMLNGGGVAFQINVNLNNKGKELHVFNAPYGGDEYRSIEEAVGFQELVAKKAREYTKFGKR